MAETSSKEIKKSNSEISIHGYIELRRRRRRVCGDRRVGVTGLFEPRSESNFPYGGSDHSVSAQIYWIVFHPRSSAFVSVHSQLDLLLLQLNRIQRPGRVNAPVTDPGGRSFIPSVRRRNPSGQLQKRSLCFSSVFDHEPVASLRLHRGVSHVLPPEEGHIRNREPLLRSHARPHRRLRLLHGLRAQIRLNHASIREARARDRVDSARNVVSADGYIVLHGVDH